MRPVSILAIFMAIVNILVYILATAFTGQSAGMDMLFCVRAFAEPPLYLESKPEPGIAHV